MYIIYLFYFNIDFYKKPYYRDKIEHGLIIVYISIEKLE